MKRRRTIYLIRITLGMAMLLASCSGIPAATKEPPEVVETQKVDQLFLNLYVQLGGIETFGPPLSDAVWEETCVCQPMMNAEFCYDLTKEGGDAYFFAPLVREANLLLPISKELPPQQGDKLVNGFTILTEFIPLYEQLYGTVFTGQPLGEARINYENNHVEQYFENIIIARDLDADNGQPYLMPVSCTSSPQYCLSDASFEQPIPVIQKKSSPFGALLSRINGQDFGEPLTKPFLNNDDQLMQIFESIVVVSPPDQINTAHIYSLPDEMDMIRMEPVAQRLGELSMVSFYPTEENGDGFHVPVLFDDFVGAHGGRNISGAPIAEAVYYDDDTMRQCFESYCLDYQQQGGVQIVTMAPLGAWYLDRELEAGRISPEVLLGKWLKSEDLLIGFGEQRDVLPPDTEQFLIVSIQELENTKPVSGIGGKVWLTLESGQVEEFLLPETNSDGISFVTIPASFASENGAVLRYEIWLHLSSGEDIYHTGAYVVHETNTP